MSDVPRDYIERAKAFAAIAASTEPPKISALQRGFDLARIESYGLLPGLREGLHAAAQGKSNRFHAGLYAELVYLTVFELQWREIRTFKGFAALMIELLGDDVQPFLVSLYLAGLHHPDIGGLRFDWAEAVALLGRPERGSHQTPCIVR